jgi:hypothetical protein
MAIQTRDVESFDHAIITSGANLGFSRAATTRENDGPHGV